VFTLALCLLGQAQEEKEKKINDLLNALANDDGAIRTMVGHFFLLRRDKQFCAAKILRETPDNGAEYEWYFQGDGSGNFQKSNCKHGQGKVFEKYKRELINDKEQLTDIGSVLDIKCGPLSVEWSSGNFIYAHDLHLRVTNIEIALTDWTSIDKVDVFPKTLKWVKYKPDEK
jgi:hypothetical protein